MELDGVSGAGPSELGGFLISYRTPKQWYVTLTTLALAPNKKYSGLNLFKKPFQKKAAPTPVLLPSPIRALIVFLNWSSRCSSQGREGQLAVWDQLLPPVYQALNTEAAQFSWNLERFLLLQTNPETLCPVEYLIKTNKHVNHVNKCWNDKFTSFSFEISGLGGSMDTSWRQRNRRENLQLEAGRILRIIFFFQFNLLWPILLFIYKEPFSRKFASETPGCNAKASEVGTRSTRKCFTDSTLPQPQRLVFAALIRLKNDFGVSGKDLDDLVWEVY
jgi:hypothetical protein